jgi:hypothetical protein
VGLEGRWASRGKGAGAAAATRGCPARGLRASAATARSSSNSPSPLVPPTPPPPPLPPGLRASRRATRRRSRTAARPTPRATRPRCLRCSRCCRFTLWPRPGSSWRQARWVAFTWRRTAGGVPRAAVAPPTTPPFTPPPPHTHTTPQGHFAKAVLCLLPLGLATFITMSRVVGYKHDFSDINCGGGPWGGSTWWGVGVACGTLACSGPPCVERARPAQALTRPPPPPPRHGARPRERVVCVPSELPQVGVGPGWGNGGPYFDWGAVVGAGWGSGGQKPACAGPQPPRACNPLAPLFALTRFALRQPLRGRLRCAALARGGQARGRAAGGRGAGRPAARGIGLRWARGRRTPPKKRGPRVRASSPSPSPSSPAHPLIDANRRPGSLRCCTAALHAPKRAPPAPPAAPAAPAPPALPAAHAPRAVHAQPSCPPSLCNGLASRVCGVQAWVGGARSCGAACGPDEGAERQGVASAGSGGPLRARSARGTPARPAARQARARRPAPRARRPKAPPPPPFPPLRFAPIVGHATVPH